MKHHYFVESSVWTAMHRVSNVSSKSNHWILKHTLLNAVSYFRKVAVRRMPWKPRATLLKICWPTNQFFQVDYKNLQSSQVFCSSFAISSSHCRQTKWRYFCFSRRPNVPMMGVTTSPVLSQAYPQRILMLTSVPNLSSLRIVFFSYNIWSSYPKIRGCHHLVRLTVSRWWLCRFANRLCTGWLKHIAENLILLCI